MDSSLLLYFVGINFVSIQALANFRNVDSNLLQKYLHSNDYQNPFTNGAQPRNPPRKTFFKFNQEGEPIYALVIMDVVNASKKKPSTESPLTYYGNEKWSVPRDRFSKNKQGRRVESGKLKPSKRALVSYEELSGLTISNKKRKRVSSYEKPGMSLIKQHRPGDSLLQSNGNNLESAGKFPVTEKSSLVYGNLENLGLAQGETNSRLMFTNFRKTNNLVDLFNTAIPKSKPGPKQWIVLEITPKIRNPQPMTRAEEENSASEILDEYAESDDEDYRRKMDKKKKKNSKFRKRENYNSDWKSSGNESSSSTSSSAESSSTSEKNDGNPYTIHKGKYKQNWMWNHNMDGDHVNINPYGPLFNDLTATAQDLFFGRKWWYFNQDDFKPMG